MASGLLAELVAAQDVVILADGLVYPHARSAGEPLAVGIWQLMRAEREPLAEVVLARP